MVDRSNRDHRDYDPMAWAASLSGRTRKKTTISRTAAGIRILPALNMVRTVPVYGLNMSECNCPPVAQLSFGSSSN
jgi:hypothetical protein